MFKYKVRWKWSIPADVACTLHTDVHIMPTKATTCRIHILGRIFGKSPGKRQKRKFMKEARKRTVKADK
jgi:hypothetical protein